MTPIAWTRSQFSLPSHRAHRRQRAPRLFGLLGFVTALGVIPAARADDKSACVQSYERSQSLRREGKLRRARDELRTCSRGVCPALVRNDCVSWLEQVEASFPSIVIRADKDGTDVAAVRVVEDNEVIATRLDGKSIEVEPGEHSFRFEIEGAAPVSLTLVVHEAEKNRVIPLRFVSPHHDGAVGASTPEGDMTSRPVPTGVYVFGGIGLAGLAGFAILGSVGRSDESSLKSSCSPNCAEGDISSVRTKYVGADVSLALGVASLATAAIWYFVRPTAAPPPAVARLSFTPLPSGGAASWSSAF